MQSRPSILFAMAGAWLAWRHAWRRHAATPRASWVGDAGHRRRRRRSSCTARRSFPTRRRRCSRCSWSPCCCRHDAASTARCRRSRSRDMRRRHRARRCCRGCTPATRSCLSASAPALCAAIAARRDWRALAAFVTPAALLALAWFGFFFVIYGTPESVGAVRRLHADGAGAPAAGPAGLLFDQQFGLLASAPVLALALVSLRPRRPRDRAARLVDVAVLVLDARACVHLRRRRVPHVVGRTSAPARFLVPLVLPLAPLIALGWQSLRTRASRHLAVALLVVSLALTAVLVCVDHGALAYNVRDGRARWALWVEPARRSRRGAAGRASRRARASCSAMRCIWLAGLAVAWVLWRGTRTPRAPDAVGDTAHASPLLVPAASATAWAWHGVDGLAPAPRRCRTSQRRAESPAATLIAITPPPRDARGPGSTSNRFARDREAASGLHACCGWTRLPAGRYRLFTDVRAPGRQARRDARARRGRRASSPNWTPRRHTRRPSFDLALPVQHLVVKGSREAVAATGRTWLMADEVALRRQPAPPRARMPWATPCGCCPRTTSTPNRTAPGSPVMPTSLVGSPRRTPLDVSLRAGACRRRGVVVGARRRGGAPRRPARRA